MKLDTSSRLTGSLYEEDATIDTERRQRSRSVADITRELRSAVVTYQIAVVNYQIKVDTARQLNSKRHMHLVRMREKPRWVDTGRPSV
ncbi:MAG TPA: hypothetical protein VHQ03_08835 [Candidatus Dormibacteraeota bacterium]|nr:hypothetical protein [Candidatus Dormibacteraeota bacterium]